MSAEPKVGGEADAFCTKCNLLLAHTILAMVGPKIARVRCNTCNSERAYRGQVVPASAKKPRKKRVAAAEKVVISFNQRLEGKDLSKARKYSVRETFAVDEIIDHPTFGIGVVNARRDDKIDVAFKAFEKTLQHGKGEGLKPTFQSMHAAGPVSDAPVASEELPSTPDGGSSSV